MKYFNNKWIWITGASSGLGKQLVLTFDKFHAHILLSSRSENKLEEVKQLCNGNGQKHVLPLDLSKHENLSEKVEEAMKIAPHIDILINNGGISQRSEALDTELSVTERIMNVNFIGSVEMTKGVLPGMLKRGKGQIVVISSVVGKFGSKYRSSYSASKHALHGYFDSLRFEVEDQGVDVTLICPGFVNTDVSKNALTADGSPLNKIDKKTAEGLTPEAFAQKAVKVIAKSKPEAYIGKSETMAVYLKRFFPALFRYVLRRVNVR